MNETGILQEFLLKQLENELHAGMVLVAEARRTYKLAELAPVERNERAPNSQAELVHAVTSQVLALREAIEQLRTARFGV